MQFGDSLILLVYSLSLSPFFNTAVLSFFPPISSLHPHIFLSASCACLAFVATELNRVAQTPNGISSYTVYAVVSPFAPFAILGNEVRVKRRERKGNETWKGGGGGKQYLGACEYVSIKVSGSQRQRPCPMSCQIRPNRKDISQGGAVGLPFSIDLFRHLDSIRNQSCMMRD